MLTVEFTLAQARRSEEELATDLDAFFACADFFLTRGKRYSPRSHTVHNDPAGADR